VKLFTIGFAGSSAESFFGRIQDAGVVSLLDVRLKPNSQLSGFAKAKDLPFFLAKTSGADYRPLPELAPTTEMLDAYRKRKMSWDEYAVNYLRMLDDRKVAEILSPKEMDGGCLLCSESKPHQCHRRLAAEYLRSNWQADCEIRHL
jgi:uncharacterized protein (DUF488 family)